MRRINTRFYKSRVGELMLGAYEGRLCLLDYRYRKRRTAIDNRIRRGLGADFIEREDAVIEKAIVQIEEYLDGHRTQFDVPILTVGSAFQKAVWDALLKVPYGATSTYSQLARDIDRQEAVRAVASANGANAISLIVPCHRIIETNGGLGGYAGGLPAKRRLINLESSNSLPLFAVRQ